MDMADIKAKIKSQQEIVDRILKYLASTADNSAGENEMREKLNLQSADMDILTYMIADGLIIDWEDLYNAKAVELVQYSLTAKGEQMALLAFERKEQNNVFAEKCIREVGLEAQRKRENAEAKSINYQTAKKERKEKRAKRIAEIGELAYWQEQEQKGAK